MTKKKTTPDEPFTARYRRDEARARRAEAMMISRGCTQRSSEVFAKLCYTNGWTVGAAVEQALSIINLRAGGADDFKAAANMTDRSLAADKGARRLLSESETTCSRCKGPTVLINLSQIHAREEGSTMYCKVCDLPAGLVML